MRKGECNSLHPRRAGPSGPSIEGPFCRAVHLCRALGDRKIEKESKKKKENCRDCVYFLCTSVFLDTII